MKLRVGIVGCGLITQAMHIHYLKELNELFEITAICDVSPSTLENVGERFRIPNRYTNWQDLINDDIDLVMILTPGSHAPIAIAAAEAGKHVFCEKPMCITLREADEMIAAAKKANVTLMVGNMKRFDPGYLYGLNEVQEMQDLLHVRVSTLEAPIAPYVKHLPLFLGAKDIPREVRAAFAEESEILVKEALGEVPDLAKWVYRMVLLDSLVHEVNALRGILGEPEKVLFTDVWKEGEGFTSIIRWPNEVDCTLSWVNLPKLPNYVQELSFYSPDKRVSIKFPSPFMRNEPTPVHIEEMITDTGFREQEVVVSYEEAFKNELLHLHNCIATGIEPVTNGLEAKKDIAVMQAMIKAWVNSRPEEIENAELPIIETAK